MSNLAPLHHMEQHVTDVSKAESTHLERNEGIKQRFWYILKSIPPTPAELIKAEDGQDAHRTQTLTWVKRFAAAGRPSVTPAGWVPAMAGREGACWESPAQLPALRDSQLDILGQQTSSLVLQNCSCHAAHTLFSRKLSLQGGTQHTSLQPSRKNI